MQNKEDKKQDIFLPICTRCGDILSIEIDPLTFKINYYCLKEDIKKNASFKFFEGKYIKNINSLNNDINNSINLPKYYLYDEIKKN